MIQSSPTTKMLKEIYTHIEQRELKQAIDRVKVAVEHVQNWTITERITELETNYRFMLHYLIEGQKDPQQQYIYEKLIRDLYAIADDAAELLLLQESSTLYFDKARLQQVCTSPSMDDYRKNLLQQIDTFSLIDLLEEGEEKVRRLRENELAYEKMLQDLFYMLFVSPRSHADMLASFRAFIDDDHIPVYDKSVFISALTLNVLQRFDAGKVELLLDICRHHEVELVIRAIIGFIPIFQTYRSRIPLYRNCSERLKLLSDDKLFNRRFVAAILGYIQAHETEKITKKLNEEIIPEMMKLSPMIGKKINLDEWIGESGVNEKNPEWQKILDESGLTDKLQEFSELQLKGADVFHSTFSNLKSYPFFNEMCNWFLPFNPRHSSIRQLFEEKGEGSSLIETMFSSSLICNSDKYSFCFSIMMMPENYRRMMISQLGAEGEELSRMQAEEAILQPHQKEDTLIKQYIQDLYRFFKLFRRRKEFVDIFNLPLNYHQIEAFHPVVLQPHNLEKIALYYFEKNNFTEALTAYQMLTEIGNTTQSEVWQKIGYCKQMILDTEGALEAYLHADLIEENNTWVMQRVAHCYRALKQPETALTYYRRLEQIRPDDLHIQLLIGHCYLELKEYDKSLNRYFKVELIDSNNRRAWRSVAWCAFLSRKFDVARKYYDRILEDNPTAHDWLNAGHVELCLEENKKAIQYYRSSMEKAGSFEDFRLMLADDEDELQEAGVNTNILPVILDKMRYDLS